MGSVTNVLQICPRKQRKQKTKKGLSQIEFFDFSPVKEQQKTKINRLI
jgi:hypothetical protein